MIRELKNGACYRLCAASLILSLSGCATTGASRTVSSLAGSSAGAVAANAISVAGPWGYLISLATSSLGGLAGGKLASLFGGKKQDAQLTALSKVLQSQQITSLEPWGAQDGKEPGGYAEATGPVFKSNAGANCRSFMLVTYKKKGGFSLDPLALQNAVSTVGDIKNSAEKLSDLSNIGDAVSGAKSAVGAVANATDTVAALSADQKPAGITTVDLPAGSERFGTACQDKKSVWQVVKSKA